MKIFKPRSPFERSVSVDSATEATEELTSKHLSASRQFKSSQNLVSDKDKGKSELKLSKLYHRLSGSVSSLFQANSLNGRRRQLSASDTDLSARKPNGRVLSQQQLIDQDYCPSVIYNRKQRHVHGNSDKNGEKSLTFNRLKNQLLLRFTRKKNDIGARKT